MSSLGNIGAIARREYGVRIRTRSFLFGTLLLVLGVTVIALVPVIIRAVDRHDSQVIALHVGAADLATDPVATLTALLNASASTAPDGTARTRRLRRSRGARPRPGTRRPPSPASMRPCWASSGRQTATWSSRSSPMTTRPAGRRRPIRQASNAIAIGDRLSRLGVAPGSRRRSSPRRRSRSSGRTRPGPSRSRTRAPPSGQDLLAFGMTVLIFMMIILYGTWIAMSVVEEKSSRVMEVILNAATPVPAADRQGLRRRSRRLDPVRGAIVAARWRGRLLQGPVARRSSERRARRQRCPRA